MDNLFLLLFLASIGGVGYGAYQGVSNKFKKNKQKKKDAKRIILASAGALVISFVGIGITAPPIEDTPQSTKAEIVATEATDDSGERKKENAKIEQLKKEKQEAELLALAQKEEQKKFDDDLQELRTTLADLEYDGTQTIELNDNTPLFGPLDLSLEKGSWETYGDLDKLNRATSAEAMLNQDLMPSEKRGDISNIDPTGWKNKKLGKSYLYNRSHLIGFSLSGENDNWKNLITGTAQLNNPEMLRHEMDIKNYLEKTSNNYVRYSVTPIFKDDELLARGVHLMAQSTTDDSIRFNVYIHNIQDGAKLNYADGSSVTDEELKAEADKKEQVAKENAEKERLAKEQAEAEKAKQEQAAAKAEQDRIAAEQAEAARIQAEQAEAARVAEENRLAEEAENQQVVAQTVYIAPDSGTKYHFNQSCRGLSQANSIASLSLSDAQAQGYDLCGWED